MAAYEQLGTECADIIDWRTSVLERYGQAMFLKSHFAIPSLAARSQGEICHVHMSDLSAHVMLSLPDAQEVVAKAWGERHQLSGVILPLGYTMLYAIC